MMESMKGATQLLGSMNRQMNLPALQRIAMEFEKENDIMDQRQEMMDDAIDDVTGLEDEEEGEEVVNQVLDEIGVDLSQTVSPGLDVHTGGQPTNFSSLAKHRKDFKRTRWRKARSRKQLEVVERIRETTTCRHV
jgi:division protein CdvB (Snf7/Vps24/ESCRT-III family)